MRCPHCGVGIRLDEEEQATYRSRETTELGTQLAHGFCPECKKLIVLLRNGQYRWIDDRGELVSVEKEQVLYPAFAARIIDDKVPEHYRRAFNEANAVLIVSPKASAALSRRLLQNILWDEYKIKHKNLDLEISEFMKRSDIPPVVSGAVDAVRNIGNFAAHPMKYINTGEVVDVEPGEAEWLLEVIEAMFDVTFVQPKQVQEKSDKLNKKLAALGKPPLKS